MDEMRKKCDLDIVKFLYLEKNKKIKTIAKIFGVSYITVWHWLRRNNIPTRKELFVDEERLKQLYNQKLDCTKIGRILGVSHQTISRRLKKIGLRVRGIEEYPVSEETRKKQGDASRGKSYEERYGADVAKKVKEIRSKKFKGLKWSKSH